MLSDKINQIESSEKLAKIVSYIKGDNFEKNASWLNKVLRRIGGAWLCIEPVTGSIVSGAILASDVLDDLLQGLSSASKEDIDIVFHNVLSQHEDKLRETYRRLELLTPKAGVVYAMGEWVIRNSHGISSITDHGNDHFSINFTALLAYPDEFIALCNVSGTHLDVHEAGVDVRLPKNFDSSVGLIKVVLHRVTGFNPVA